MSDDLFYTRLRWANGKGIAKYKGCVVALTEPPDVVDATVVELIYTPEVHVCRVRTFGSPWRDLVPNEIEVCMTFLRKTANGGKA